MVAQFRKGGYAVALDITAKIDGALKAYWPLLLKFENRKKEYEGRLAAWLRSLQDSTKGLGKVSRERVEYNLS